MIALVRYLLNPDVLTKKYSITFLHKDSSTDHTLRVPPLPNNREYYGYTNSRFSPIFVCIPHPECSL